VAFPVAPVPAPGEDCISNPGGLTVLVSLVGRGVVNFSVEVVPQHLDEGNEKVSPADHGIHSVELGFTLFPEYRFHDEPGFLPGDEVFADALVGYAAPPVPPVPILFQYRNEGHVVFPDGVPMQAADIVVVFQDDTRPERLPCQTIG